MKPKVEYVAYMRPFLVLLCAILFPIYSCSGTDTGNPITHGGYSDETETIVTGVLADSLGNPAARCSLWLRSNPSASMRSPLARVLSVVDSPFVEAILVTDSSGAFTFQGIPGGDYVLHAISLDKDLGLQAKFSIHSRHTLTWVDTLRLHSLTHISLLTPMQFSGIAPSIVELGIQLAASDTLHLPAIPEGTYTFAFSEDTLQWLLYATPGYFTLGNPPTKEYLTADTSGPSFFGTADQSVIWFTSSMGQFTDSRDGSSYGFVQIDTLYWMQENLHYPMKGSSCNPNDSLLEGSCSTFGRYYNALHLDSACPAGWVIPTSQEWSDLAFGLGGITGVGYMLKSYKGWENRAGTNAYGMNIVPAGSSLQTDPGKTASFWSRSSEYNTPYTRIHFCSEDDQMYMDALWNAMGEDFTLRCVRPLSLGL